MKKLTAPAVIALALILALASPATAAITTHKNGKINQAPTVFYLTIHSEKRGGATWVTGATVGYTDPKEGLKHCSQIRSIKMNVGPIAGRNPKTTTVRCSDGPVSKWVNIKDSKLQPGNTDRCAGMAVHVDVIARRDGHYQVPKACAP